MILENEGNPLIIKFNNMLTRNMFDSEFDTQEIAFEEFEIRENQGVSQSDLPSYDNFIKAVMICR